MTPVWYRSLGLSIDPGPLMLVVTLCFARTLPMLFLNPFLGGSSVPGPVKMGMAGSFTLILLPSLLQAPSPMPGGFAFAFLFLKELAIGATIGFLSSLVFWAFATAGRLVDTQRGANMAEVMVFQLQDRTSYFGVFYLQAAVVIFLLLNGHHLFLRGFFKSFEILPVWSFPGFTAAPAVMADDLIKVTGGLFTIALQMSAPAVIALFLTDAAFGILNRSAPQINVFSLSQPVKMLLGMLMVLLTLEAVFGRMEVYLSQMVEDTGRFIGYLKASGVGP